MSNQKSAARDEDLLLQDFSRNVTTKSWALFIGNAAVVSAIPLCKSIESMFSYAQNNRFILQGSSGVSIKWILQPILFILLLVQLLAHTFLILLIKI